MAGGLTGPGGGGRGGGRRGAPEGVLRAARELAEGLWAEALRAERPGGGEAAKRLAADLESSLQERARPLLREVARERLGLGERGTGVGNERTSSSSFRLSSRAAGKTRVSGQRTRGDQAGKRGTDISPPRLKKGGADGAGRGRPVSAPAYRSPYEGTSASTAAGRPPGGYPAGRSDRQPDSPQRARPQSGRPGLRTKKDNDAEKMRRCMKAACRDLDWLKEVGQRRRQNHRIHKAAMRFIQGTGPDGELVAVGAGEDSAEEGGSWDREADATANVAQNKSAKTADGALFRDSLAESSSATLVSLDDMSDGSRGDGGAKGGGGDSNDFPDLDSELEEALSPGPQGW